jgi:hypothetical protein
MTYTNVLKNREKSKVSATNSRFPKRVPLAMMRINPEKRQRWYLVQMLASERFLSS